MTSEPDEYPDSPGMASRRPTFASALRDARGRARIVILLLLMVVGAGLAAAGHDTWELLGEQAEVESENRIAVQREMAEAGARIDEELAEVVPVTHDLAERFERGPLPTPAEMDALFRATLDANPHLHGVGIAFAPFAYSADRRLVGPYAVRDTDSTVITADYADEVDYTRYEHEWFWNPRFDGARWNEPYYEPTLDQIVLEYGVPVHLPGSDPETDLPGAVVFGNFSLDEIDAHVNEMGFGRSGYGFLFSRDGHFISHPRRDYLRRTELTAAGDTTVRTRTIFEVAWDRGDTALHTLGVTTINGHERIVDYRDPVTGQDAWIAYGPVEGPRWTIASVMLLDDLRADPDVRRRALLRITGYVTLALACLLIAVLIGVARRRAERGAGSAAHGIEHILWIGAIGLTVLPITAIGVIWFFALRNPPTRFDDEVRVMDAAMLSQEMDNENGILARETTIPTGIFLQSVDFQSGVTVSMTGSIWQKYSLTEHTDVTQGIVLPEAQDVELNEVSRRVDGDMLVVEWSFAGSFRQEFNYEKFPLDRHEVWLRVLPADHRSGVSLVPDFDSYPITNPAALLGIADGLVLPGWRPEGSYFSYRQHEYSTNFADSSFGFEGERPELYFSLVVRRNFLQPFISTIIPLLVAASMLFAILLLSTKRDDVLGLRGFSAMEVVLGAAALFFVFVFQHISIRTEIPSQNIIYVEYFYFAMYIALLAVSVNAIIFASGSRVRWLQANDNLAPKVLFWPAYLTAALAVTFWVFY